MFIADTMKHIKENENYLVEEGMIEKLDKMLTEYGVQHFFSLPIETDENGCAKDGYVLEVFYDSKDDLTFTLVYALWAKTIRNATDEMIWNGFKEIVNEM